MLDTVQEYLVFGEYVTATCKTNGPARGFVNHLPCETLRILSNHTIDSQCLDHSTTEELPTLGCVADPRARLRRIAVQDGQIERNAALSITRENWKMPAHPSAKLGVWN
jgi:hypothetical protein